jgi:hypothetical protein
MWLWIIGILGSLWTGDWGYYIAFNKTGKTIWSAFCSLACMYVLFINHVNIYGIGMVALFFLIFGYCQGRKKSQQIPKV